MILEEETLEAFGYYARDLEQGTRNPILAVCELCGKIRVIRRAAYRTFCRACSLRLGGKLKGKKNGRYKPKIKCKCLWCGKEFLVYPSVVKTGGGKYCSRKCKEKAERKKVKCTCLVCGEGFEVKLSVVKRGKGKYCSMKCMGKAERGEKHSEYKGGKKVTRARARAKRKRQLSYTLLMPLVEGEAGHHVTNEYVIGIPADVHKSFSGYTRKRHRTLVLQWLKENDITKYKLVLEVL